MPPLEVTTHNLYFHEQSSIFSLDSHLDNLATGGGDGFVRLWKVITSPGSLDSFKYCTALDSFKYCTALDSSTKIEYISDIHSHSKTVNCVRFNSKGDLASCSDGGRVIVTNNDKTFSIRNLDGVDIYDLVWTNDFLVVGTSNGTIEMYLIKNQFKKVLNRKIHSDIIQSQAYSPIHKLLVTVSKDSSSCLMEVIYEEEIQSKAQGEVQEIEENKSKEIQGVTQDNKTQENTPQENIRPQENKAKITTPSIKLLDRLDKFFSTTRGFYRRLSFSSDGKFLYLVSCKANTLVVLSYPFRDEHVFCKIGPLDSEVVKVIDKNYFFVVTKKSVYIFSKSWELKSCVENITFKSTTDGTYCCGLLFVSSLDGFISSIKI
ncbi:WD repeat-containing protein [Nosema bombycis CQ1]|uniref:WD repeat-containing protein n=1 Tax=Nosema bombycis (strain CQ1 / CVCC 102059) TaxID=578461 RepID=R0KQ32_NOSB1|nr:WD repeat-containing protein [Nosema bombycis CQ1]|eukprot:EOB12312.1 WD repeat-containing protein [Nosema bombycis CQ1]